MADTMIILEDCEILSTNVNTWEKNGETRTFMTAYCHIEGAEEGQEKSRIFEMSCEDPIAFEYLKKIRRKGKHKLVAIERRFRDNSRFIYMDTVENYFKPAANA